jgi:hypothetical protein
VRLRLMHDLNQGLRVASGTRRRLFVALVLLVALAGSPRPEAAEDGLVPARLGLQPVPLIGAERPARSAAVEPIVLRLPRAPLPVRPAPLIPLYASFVALQVGDLATTFRALDGGASEANPALGGLASNRAAMVALKAGMTTGTLLLSERLWKRNRVATIVLMAAMNGAYLAVVAHNARVISSLPGR